jgi:4-hydroxybenzoate polyprenyltransferase
MRSYFFMQQILQVYRFLNILSLDIVAGAVISALFFSEFLDVQILPYGLLALALTVWIIYTADHLRDARAIKHEASSNRHRFHQRHFKKLLILLSTAVVIDSVIILFIRTAVFEWGLILAVIVILYLVIQKHLRALKELFVAILYTCGVLLPSVAVTPIELDTVHIVLIIQFTAVAWVNLLVFSWFDYRRDMADEQSSFATFTGKPLTEIFIWGLTSIQILAVIPFWQSELYRLPAILFLSMNAILILVFVRARRTGRADKFRLLGDAVFFIPGFYLLWTHL